MKNHEINNAEVKKKDISECTDGENECYGVIVLINIPFFFVCDKGSVIVEND